MAGVNQWLSFYENEYTYKGKLIGRYYNSYGNPTEYQKQVIKTLQDIDGEKRRNEDLELKYPPCNSEWNRESGTRVWCSKMSGGIRRDWTGVPRMLYLPGSDSYRCACVKDPEDPSTRRSSREYPGCEPRSTSCRVFT
ncbi:neuferricin isoform X2 [Bacillus rossius redtenbacheri]